MYALRFLSIPVTWTDTCWVILERNHFFVRYGVKPMCVMYALRFLSIPVTWTDTCWVILERNHFFVRYGVKHILELNSRGCTRWTNTANISVRFMYYKITIMSVQKGSISPVNFPLGVGLRMHTGDRICLCSDYTFYLCEIVWSNRQFEIHMYHKPMHWEKTLCKS